MKPNKPQGQSAANLDTGADLAAWLFSGDTADIDEFILAGSSGIRSEDLRAITKESPCVYEKIYAAREAGLSDLNAHTRLIMQTLEFSTRSHAVDPLPAYLAEGTFAAQYLLKEHDLIPDQVPGIGLIDDAILIKRVFSRNELEFMRAETLPALASSPQNRKCALAYENEIKTDNTL
jgi:uncharacterized membrane protein YkvA (DUF1232 family)